ncbi:MAG: hypothetical protein KME25_21400 [Symplocastrum torsivum CPER-KK1]|jgi:hypothetical protein|uniref:Uncharacterized protein n=1 Tax=Symplocastrum torsivum CPER-KK1 TaxID=450513 RepID=A0A951UBK2_9CYAN|nr:hypothetical protein [Symplocastrum torsivum CPER-KK1]
MNHPHVVQSADRGRSGRIGGAHSARPPSSYRWSRGHIQQSDAISRLHAAYHLGLLDRYCERAPFNYDTEKLQH